jgi:hypothetical protein
MTKFVQPQQRTGKVSATDNPIYAVTMSILVNCRRAEQ